MFLFKKMIAPLFLPLSFSILLLLMSLLYLQFRQTLRRGKYFVFFAILLLLAPGQNYLADLLLKTLESQYQPLQISQVRGKQPPVKWVVVLGGGAIKDARLSAVQQLSEPSVSRLLEAVQIHRQLPGSRLLVSGWAYSGGTTEAQLMAKAAESFGVRPKDIVVDPQSRDTEEQVGRIHALTGKDRVVLVTSAYHMPRAVGLFKTAGLDPVPAPTHFLTSDGTSPLRPEHFYPSAEGLAKSEIAAHEYIGILWSKIRGRM